eukprot:4059280-Pleurochrysis_carterae.AAC.1
MSCVGPAWDLRTDVTGYARAEDSMALATSGSPSEWHWPIYPVVRSSPRSEEAAHLTMRCVHLHAAQTAPHRTPRKICGVRAAGVLQLLAARLLQALHTSAAPARARCE